MNKAAESNTIPLFYFLRHSNLTFTLTLTLMHKVWTSNISNWDEHWQTDGAGVPGQRERDAPKSEQNELRMTQQHRTKRCTISFLYIYHPQNVRFNNTILFLFCLFVRAPSNPEELQASNLCDHTNSFYSHVYFWLTRIRWGNDERTCKVTQTFSVN